MADEHMQQAAILLERADRVIAPATPVHMDYDERLAMVPQLRLELKLEALVHAVLHLADVVERSR